MLLELSTEWIVTSACVAISTMVGLYTKNLRTTVDDLKEANQKEHDNLKIELSEQKKTLNENHDAVIRLISVVEQLNQTLIELKLTMKDRVSIQQCELLRDRHTSK